MGINKAVFAFAFFLLIMMFVAIPSYNGGWAKDVFEEGEYSFDAGIGYHYVDVDGYRGKVGEYEVLDSGMEGYFTLKANTRSKYFDLEGQIKDEDDQYYMMDVDANRIFQSETSYNRYRHYLDHDPLSNQDYFTDFDAGIRNSIVWEELKSNNAIRIPFIPNLKIHADFRQQNKRGHRQATTVSKCTQCHVTSRNRRVDQTTEDMNIGAEVTIGHLNLNYNFLQRTFNGGGRSPIAYYGFEVPSFPVKGFQEYNNIPDSRTYINKIEAKADLPVQSEVSFHYETGENRNRDTHYKRDFNSYAFRFTTAALKYVIFNFSHSDYDMDNDVPDSMEKDVQRSVVSFRTKPWKRNFLRGSYRWEDIDRNNSAQGSTSKKVFRLSYFSRPHRKVDFNVRYKNERVDDPFANEEWGLFNYRQTSMPTRTDDFQLSLNWNPVTNLSLSSTLNYVDSDSNSYHIDEERTEFMFSIWYAPRDNLILTGSYSLIDTSVDTRSAYKTYHVSDLSAVLFDNHIPYDDRSSCYHVMVNYRFNRNIALTTDFTFTDSNSDFDSSVYGSNVGQFSDLDIERIDTTIGLDYLYKPYLSFYTKYNYRDYNDREANELDGKAHIVSIGLNYAF
jgi:hypothetical protein